MSEASYDLLRSNAAVIAGRSGLVWVTGPDAVTFLDALLSQNVAAMEPGTTARSLLLAPNGKLRATLLVLRGEDRVGLVCDAQTVPVVVGDLLRFKIRVDVEIRAEDRPVWDVWGPGAHSAVASLPEEGRWHEPETVVRMPFRFSELPRVVTVGEAPDLPHASADVAELVRIEVGEPTMGIDLDDKTIPQEGVDVAASVDFAKGCYLGQELVARIDSRGHVNRRLRGVTVGGNHNTTVGAEIDYQGKTVGILTSTAHSAGLGSMVGLALVRVEVADGADVTVNGLPGSVVGLPIRA